ncbi:MAG: 4-alpha-glucanotransferase [Chloroflexi bacterium]|nr:4-alpha-glucanotransferase [Chloroflexota bacterium]
MSATRRISPLHQLARLYDVQLAYYDVDSRRQSASREVLLTVLRLLGASVVTFKDVPSALRERRQALWQRGLEPVAVAWNGGPLALEVRLPAATADGPLVGHLTLEGGGQERWEWEGAALPAVEAAQVEGIPYLVKQLPLPGGLPWGYHRFILESRGTPLDSLIIVAPVAAFATPEARDERAWGVFLPLYALHTRRSWGCGDLTDLATFVAWLAEMKSGMVATLPLLAAFLDEPFEASPYAPASRLMWNEFYLDVTAIPELKESPAAQALLSSPSFQKELDALGSSPLVDYRRQMALKRSVLEEMSHHCFAVGGERFASLQRFGEDYPAVEEYARFRATLERRRTPWPTWPAPLRDGVLKEGDYDEGARRYHLFVQWQAQEQFHALSRKAKELGVKLYMDMPLGAHPDGYDVWKHREQFVQGASMGAPPDTYFPLGQDWGLPPPHPEGLRRHGYRYYIASLRHLLQHTAVLRIDHVMGLHRLFWVPWGTEPRHGVYVRYRPQEFYAILTLESHRHQTMLVGEDLGTVPPPVRPAMARHGLHRMYVIQYQMSLNPQQALRPVPKETVASLNTHDMPPFAALWQGLDTENRLRLGLLDERQIEQEREEHRQLLSTLVTFLRRRGLPTGEPPDLETVIRSMLTFLCASRAHFVLVNLEDLWLEAQPQNTPGTKDTCPNWRLKARYDWETFSRLPQVVDVLHEIGRLRKQGNNPPW